MPAPTTSLRTFPRQRRRALPRLAKAFRDHFFGPQNLVPPEKTALYSHHDSALVFREFRGLVTHHTMKCTVHHLLGLDLTDFHPVQDLGQRMNCVLEIVPPLHDLAALAFAS